MIFCGPYGKKFEPSSKLTSPPFWRKESRRRSTKSFRSKTRRKVPKGTSYLLDILVAGTFWELKRACSGLQKRIDFPPVILSKNFYVDTTKSIDVIPIGHEVRRVVKESAAEEGQVVVTLPFSGAGLVVMEPDIKVEELKKNLKPFLDNGLIRCFLPKSIVLPVEKGGMATEPWQNIFLMDYDNLGKRREFRVQVQWEAPAAPAQPPAPQY